MSLSIIFLNNTSWFSNPSIWSAIAASLSALTAFLTYKNTRKKDQFTFKPRFFFNPEKSTVNHLAVLKDMNKDIDEDMIDSGNLINNYIEDTQINISNPSNIDIFDLNIDISFELNKELINTINKHSKFFINNGSNGFEVKDGFLENDLYKEVDKVYNNFVPLLKKNEDWSITIPNILWVYVDAFCELYSNDKSKNSLELKMKLDISYQHQYSKKEVKKIEYMPIQLKIIECEGTSIEWKGKMVPSKY